MKRSRRSRASSPSTTLMAGLAVSLTAHLPAALAQETTGEPIVTAPIQVEGAGQSDPNTMRRDVPLRRIPTTVQNTPQTVSVTTREVMDQQNLISLNEVMRRTPGVTMHAGEGGGSQPPGDSFNLRGFTTQNDVFVDGIRDIGISNRDTFNLEAVEVFKGPSGTFFGRGSGAGSINLTTKQAHVGETFTNVNAGVGTSEYYRATADVNASINDKVAFRLNVLGMDREYSERDEIDTRRIGIAPTLTFEATPDTRFTLGYFYQDDDNLGDNGVPWYFAEPVTEANVDRDVFYGFTDNFEKMTTHRVTATVDHDFNDSLRIGNAFQVGFYEIDRWNTTGPVGAASLTSLFPGGITRDSFFPTQAGSHQSRGQESWSVQNQTSLGADFRTGPFNHEGVLSLDLALENYDTQRYNMQVIADPTAPVAGPDLNVMNPQFGASGLRRIKAREDETEAKSAAVSLYDRIELGYGFYVIGNVRYERYEADTEFTNPDGSQAQPDGRTRQNLWTYQAAVQYKPSENQTYYIATGRSQLPQFDAGLGYGEVSGINDNRDPQETTSYEIGGKISLFDGRLGLGAALFHIERDDQQIQDALGNVSTADYKRKVRGIELQVDGRITPSWSVSGGYAYLDSEVDAPGQAIDGGILSKTPEHSGFVWTSYQFTPEIAAGGGVTFASRRYGSDGGDKTDGNSVPSQWQLDAYASYQLTDQIRLQLNAINLTNELTYDRVHPGRQAYPGVGRTFILSTAVTF